MATVTLPEPSERDVELARSAASMLRASDGVAGFARSGAPHESHVRVQIVANGDLIELPSVVAALLRAVLEQVAAGRALSIVPIGAELTSQQAADFLGVSRPFLVKLLDEKTIPHRKVGRHRRVRFSDLLAYRAQQEVDRATALDEMTEMAQEMGDYD